MASGLDALHEQGVIHRDFKPGNVMIVQQSASRQRAVINDFGLARAAEPGDETPISRSGQVFGTPDYMAPEQLLGKPVSPATDIYALGLVMYEMVTGERAFAGGRALENAVQRVTEQPTPPRQKSPDLPVEWEEAILTCLAKDPRGRFASAREVVESLAGPLTSVESASRKPGRSAYSRRLIAAAVVLVLFVALSLAPVRSSWWNRFVGQGPGSVAMLPLSVLTDEAELRVFALGLMETMTARMSQLESTSGAVPLLVVPASEVRSQEAKTAGDAKRKFSADTAVEGTLQRQGNRLRLVLTVVDTGKMRQRETIVLEEDRANPVRLQDAAITRLANALGATLQTRFGSEASHLMTVAPGAYDYYLQARGYLQRTDQAASLESAVTLLQRALNEDSVYAPAHSALGEAYLAQFELTRDPSQVEAALQSGRKGVDLNPNLAETNIALGKIYLGVGRYQDAVQSFEKAIQIDNRKNDAYQGLANAYARLNDFAKAEATYFKAISLRPNDWTSYKALGLYYLGRREFDKAAQQFSKVIDLSPDNAQGYVNLGGAYGLAGRWPEAEKAWLQAQKLDPKRVSTLNNLARLYADRKEYPKAIALYEQVIQLNARSYRTWGQLGKAYAEVGQRAKAEECYRKAVSVLESEILVNPNNASMQSMLAFYRAVARQGNYAPPLRRSLELAPDSVEVKSQAAETYAAVGEKALAVRLLGEAFRKGYTEQSARGSSHLAPLIEAARRTNAGTSNKQ
jgi:tetratricopeptide (TPR) repeat protein